VLSSREWVYERFSEFYKDSSYNFPTPQSFRQREFAFLLFKERAMVRHKSFASAIAVRSFVRDRIPSDIYHSCAYYENPEEEMEKKGWRGSDLVFDIDADHIPTNCNKIHDDWRCCNPNCKIDGGFSGKGLTPEECPVCGGIKFDTKTWACELCIDSTKIETKKLLDILMDDFGFSEEEIHTYFSGHRGYHIHVEDDAVQELDAMARKEIVDYVTGVGLEIFEQKKPRKTKKKQKTSKQVFKLGDYGWKKRLKMGLSSYIQNTTTNDLLGIGVKKNAANIIVQNRAVIAKRCLDEERWDSIKGLGHETWMRIAEFVKNKQSAQIDTVVTSDVHRLIRANGTLHGKTGLLKIEFPLKDIDTFDPFIEAVAFKGGFVTVEVSEAPEFMLCGETFGPFRRQRVELPTAAAVLLVLKGRAEVIV
jgi:DNA primase small subunit